MPSLPHLNALGKLCGSIRCEEMVLERVKRKNSVRRMSIIEDGHIAEVLYLIPKQSMMQQLPFLNPEEYYLCERLVGVPADVGQDRAASRPAPCDGSSRSLSRLSEQSGRARLCGSAGARVALSAFSGCGGAWRTPKGSGSGRSLCSAPKLCS
ncbi:hypothetical protein AAFF_G00168820 [Aldrovandia affinis]|uniref:Uncharacterized protein n=1 Tax=Aldrovandia affinis TaxID=143900 RepID=A0AAD7RPE8_9TELE|nr:hypothetical protein AAFF_G00168820 [Aldrovandia affinis]